MADSQLLLRALIQLFTAEQQATDIRAYVDVIFSLRLAVEHRVVANYLVHLDERHIAALSHFLHQLLRDGAGLVLRVDQHRHDGRALASRRIDLKHLGELLFKLWRKSHVQRSTSPSTKSRLPSDAMESAIRWPSSSAGNACKLPKLGVRMKIRCGFEVPLLTI